MSTRRRLPSTIERAALLRAFAALDAGMNVLTYDAKWGKYRLQIDKTDLVEHADVLRGLIKQAYLAYGLG